MQDFAHERVMMRVVACGAQMDADHNGSIDKAELRSAFAAAGVELTMKEVKAMMEDPAFQESMKQYMEQITKDPQFEALKKGYIDDVESEFAHLKDNNLLAFVLSLGNDGEQESDGVITDEWTYVRNLAWLAIIVYPIGLIVLKRMWLQNNY